MDDGGEKLRANTVSFIHFVPDCAEAECSNKVTGNTLSPFCIQRWLSLVVQYSSQFSSPLHSVVSDFTAQYSALHRETSFLVFSSMVFLCLLFNVMWCFWGPIFHRP